MLAKHTELLPEENEHNKQGMDEPKKKKRTLGTFPCQHCDKVFTRSDHLRRHNLNHEPKEVYKCDFWIDEYGGNKRICGKTFVRRDLKERHTRRHLELKDGAPYNTHVPYENTVPQPSQEIQPLDSKALVPEPPAQISVPGSVPLEQPKYAWEIPQDSQPLYNYQVPQSQNDILSWLFAETTPPGKGNYRMSLQEDYSEVRRDLNGLKSPQNLKVPQNVFPQSPNGQSLHISPGGQVGRTPSIVGQGGALTGISPVTPLSQIYSSTQPQSQLQNQPQLQSQPNQSQLQNQSQQPLPNQPNQLQSQPHSNHIGQTTPSQLQAGQIPLQNQLIQNPLAKGSNGFTNQPLLSSQPMQDFRPQVNQFTSPIYPESFNQAGQLGQNGFSTIGNSPFDYNGANSYGFQDINIFLNDDNPLDEAILQIQQSDAMPINSRALQSTVPSTSSPTTTVTSSLTSPKPLPFSPESKTTPKQTLPAKLVAHATTNNVMKNKHIFMDGMIFELLVRALPEVSHEGIEGIFHHDDSSGYTMEDRLSYYLYMYWLVFHKQFTIIHKPSFDTKLAPPLLLWLMIIVGSNYSSPSQSEALAVEGKRSPELRFSVYIANPLRYKIFMHPDFRSPVKLWVLQSLNMLEWSEKNFLPRTMHERAHVHHGTTVQLLRRSPLLGGNPASLTKKLNSDLVSGSNTSAGEDDSDATQHEIAANSDKDTSDADLFYKWVELELMKRITFMTFYLDIIDYIKFRHNPQVSFYQLQLLNLPCSDELWDSRDINGSFKKLVKRQKKLQQDHKLPALDYSKNVRIRNGESFLNVLKKLLKPNKKQDPTLHLRLSVFTRKILLAGLVSIMYQMQQSELQNNSSLLTLNGIIQANSQRSKIWKEILTRAFDNWNADLIESYASALLSPVSSSIFNDISTSQVPIPMYHLSQIIGIADVNHYDIAIFGGSPANMSVNATAKDQTIVLRKLSSIWLRLSPPGKRSIHELVNLRSVVHSYLLLWQLMLMPLDDGALENTQYLSWNANRDYFDSMYAVSVATLVLWCYTFLSCGLESQRFAELEASRKDTNKLTLLSADSYEKLIQYSAEGGYQYLSRVRQEFMTNLRKDNLHKEYSIHPFRLQHVLHDGKRVVHSPHEILTKYCDLLPHILNKHNVSGLCFLVGTNLLKSQWEVIRENAKLILNCGLRSIGKKEIQCPDLFMNELADE